MITSFNPKVGTRDVKKLFLGFLRSVSISHGASSPSQWNLGQALHGKQAQGNPVPASNWAPVVTQEEVEQLVQTWGLDEECVAALASQNPDVQRALLDRFEPKETTRDVKGLFMSFLRTLSM